jgi:hypothetical protein
MVTIARGYAEYERWRFIPGAVSYMGIASGE